MSITESIVFAINWVTVRVIGYMLSQTPFFLAIGIALVALLMVSASIRKRRKTFFTTLRYAWQSTFITPSLGSIAISVFGVIIFYSILIKNIGVVSSSTGYIFDWNVLLERKTISIVANGLKYTFIISILSLLSSVLFGLLVSILKRSRLILLKYIANSYVEIIIGTPLIVQVILFYYFLAPTLGLYSNFTVGIAILSIFFGAYVSEIFRGGLESIETVQWESAKSLGFSVVQEYFYIIIPQVLKNILPSLAGQFALIVKGSALLSIVGIAEVTKRYQELDSQEFAPAEFYTGLAIVYLCMTIPISIITKHFERKMKNEQ